MLNSIVKANGVYDILCALSILKIISIPYLKDLHLSMIKDYSRDNNNELFERFLAYWIFTYGVIRLSDNYTLISYTYFIEATVFMNEYRKNTVHSNKAQFVIITSLILGYLCFNNV